MRCPYCSHDETQVAETRESDEGDVVRRRRRCLKCDKRFTTYERAEMAFPSIVKKSGARVDFDPAKPAAGSAKLSIDTASYDLGDESYNQQVRGKDWFDSAAYPQATFVSSTIAPAARTRATAVASWAGL